MKTKYCLALLYLVCNVYAQDTSAATEEVATTAAPETVTATVDTITTTVEPTSTTDVATTTAITTTATATTTPTNSNDCLTADAFSSQDYFPNKLDFNNLDAKSLFNVTYYNTYKLVHNIALDEYYVLYCTSSAPSLGDTFQSKTFIQVPVKRFAAIDTRALGYLDLLGQSNNVVYVGNTANVTSPCGTNKPSLFNVSDASLDRAAYDLALYPTSASNDPKGVGFGLSYATSPLNNAQWIKYISLFTNQESQAETIYQDISTDYQTYRDSINKEGAISYRRNITFMDYDPSSTKFNIFQDQYFKNLTSDAGATLQTLSNTKPADPSVMKGQLQNASVVIDFTDVNVFNQTYAGWQSWLGYSDKKIQSASEAALENYKNSRKNYVNDYDAPPFARYGQLWRPDLISNQGALDFWTRGFARPDLILADLIQAQYPDFFKSYQFTFFRDFDKGENTKEANTDSYKCTLNDWKKAESVSYKNSTSDRPKLDDEDNHGVTLGLIIGVSIAGGMVVIGCLAGIAFMIVRKMKDKTGGRFTKLQNETMNEFSDL